jgi:2-ketocyclohexanecarboxyl-CoA hydrolase
MTELTDVRYEVDEGLAWITIDRPDRLNAFRARTVDELIACFKRAWADASVGVVALTGAGERAFCTGGDQKQRARSGDYGPSESGLFEIEALHRVIRDIPKPVVAAVNGAAAGAGMNLALGCDIRIASTAAKFSQAFVKRGLHPDWGGTYFLPRLVGMARACELTFTGDVIDAAEALRIGLVSQVVPPEELMPAVHVLARKIAAGPPVAIRLAKRALYRNAESGLREALEFETFAQNACFETEDAREGIRAFVEKRAPVFRGR